METIEYCLSCDSAEPGLPYLEARDHLVTGRVFSMQQCRRCGMVYTNPRPLPEKIGLYYDSDRYTSHAEIATSLLEKVYMAVRRHMVEKKAGMVSRYVKPGGSILDIGCGNGLFLQTLNGKGYQVLGVEPGEKAAGLAAEKGIRVVRNMEEVNADHQPGFDLISMWHVLEHVHDLREHLHQCRQWLKPGGILLIAVPMCNSFDAGFYKQHWAAYDLPRHLWHFTPDTLQHVVQKAGLHRVKTRPMPFDAFYIAMLSEQHKKSLYKPFAFFRAMLIGLLSNAIAALSVKPASSQVFFFRK